MLSKMKFAFVSLIAAGLIFCLSNVSSAYDRGGEWPPTQGGTVIVMVTAMGAPIKGAEVSVGDNSGTTGYSGNTILSVDNGFHTVTVADHHDNTATKQVRVKAGEIVQVTFELGAAGRPATGSH
ncbi:metalloendopeptidases [Candidatus Scalindua japonica]|uniref:Metalloendopeptidases n=1 Tax=Candidatus Scalindua japonica TaxID=1284222 RepID=A0A286TY85_9BACT|nr:PEGA domain-containing protein [Candidatus Scalindua japonica]GAX60830.1 metalloendopeptidases [Candidatus Scalindua japonica]